MTEQNLNTKFDFKGKCPSAIKLQQSKQLTIANTKTTLSVKTTLTDIYYESKMAS